MSKKKVKIITNQTAYQIRKLANEHHKAVLNGDINKQITCIKKAQTIGIMVKKSGFKFGANGLELHCASQGAKQSHMAIFNLEQEMLSRARHIGVQAIDEDGHCLWAKEGSVATLDKTTVSVPEWLGTDISVANPKVAIEPFFQNLAAYISADSADLISQAANALSSIS